MDAFDDDGDDEENMMMVWMLLPPGDVILGKQHWQCCLDERAGLALLKSPEIIEIT